MEEVFGRYLRLLGIDGQPRGEAGLRLLVRRHLAAVPFENVSKLLLLEREGAGRTIGLGEFLDGIEFHDLGGTCYTANPFFAELLRALGYSADLLGADMSRPDVHTALRVRSEGRTYHVDVGFASPFREPLQVDLLPAAVQEGETAYRFEGGDGRVRVTMVEDGKVSPGYVAHPPARPRTFFDGAVAESFLPSAWFMQRLRIHRVFESHSVDLENSRLRRHEAGRTTTRDLGSIDELKAAVAEDLGLPRCPVERALEALRRIAGLDLFPAQ